MKTDGGVQYLHSFGIKSPTAMGASDFIAGENGLSAPAAHPAPPAGKRAKGTYLQYLGFTHEGNIRIYRFQRIAQGEASREFVVSVDLALFAKHHVALQEGPALSLLRLSEEADTAAAPSSMWLTDAQMLAHRASRPERGSALSARAKAALHGPAEIA